MDEETINNLVINIQNGLVNISNKSIDSIRSLSPHDITELLYSIINPETKQGEVQDPQILELNENYKILFEQMNKQVVLITDKILPRDTYGNCFFDFVFDRVLDNFPHLIMEFKTHKSFKSLLDKDIKYKCIDEQRDIHGRSKDKDKKRKFYTIFERGEKIDKNTTNFIYLDYLANELNNNSKSSIVNSSDLDKIFMLETLKRLTSSLVDISNAGVHNKMVYHCYIFWGNEYLNILDAGTICKVDDIHDFCPLLSIIKNSKTKPSRDFCSNPSSVSKEYKFGDCERLALICEWIIKRYSHTQISRFISNIYDEYFNTTTDFMADIDRRMDAYHNANSVFLDGIVNNRFSGEITKDNLGQKIREMIYAVEESIWLYGFPEEENIRINDNFQSLNNEYKRIEKAKKCISSDNEKKKIEEDEEKYKTNKAKSSKELSKRKKQMIYEHIR